MLRVNSSNRLLCAHVHDGHLVAPNPRRNGRSIRAPGGYRGRFFDIEPFLDLLFAGGEPCDTCSGDVNGDGSIDALDIEPFLNCLFP